MERLKVSEQVLHVGDCQSEYRCHDLTICFARVDIVESSIEVFSQIWSDHCTLQANHDWINPVNITRADPGQAVTAEEPNEVIVQLRQPLCPLLIPLYEFQLQFV